VQPKGKPKSKTMMGERFHVGGVKPPKRAEIPLPEEKQFRRGERENPKIVRESASYVKIDPREPPANF
jgi:hypothetical protein